MILQIGDLVIPETLSGNAEMFNNDSRRRTVSGRMIVKKAMKEKWRVTLNYEGRAIFPELRVALYRKCREMRESAAAVVFISPYDGETKTVNMFCIQPFPPKLLLVRERAPYLYSSCGAVFEEV